MRKMGKLFDKKEDCYGCGACANICPKNAIELIQDEQGFSYPKVDQEKCIECGLCSKSCQIGKESNHKNLANEKCYGFKHNNAIRIKSSSGGIYSLLSDYVIKMGGCCVGVIFDQEFNVVYKIADDEDTRNKFRGSKYVQSKTGTIYKQVGEKLLENRLVLFTGISCQVAGLKQYLEIKKINVEKLITIDMVCHGSPSPKIWKDYVAYLEKNSKGKLIDYSFRNKEHGWRGYHIKAVFDNGVVYDDNEISRTYANLFSKDLMIRPSCFYCPYTSLRRVGDITIGDFWGIEKIDNEFSDNQGISLVILNSEKGNKLFQNIHTDEIVTKEFDTSSLTQPNLYKPTDYGNDYDEFWNDYKKHNYRFVAKKYGNQGLIGKIYYYKGAIKYKLKNK